jgi:hypothetical protein
LCAGVVRRMGQDREHVMRIVETLSEQHSRAAAIALLARATGMRLREAILADLTRLKREAEHYGKINIQDGTYRLRHCCYGNCPV